MIRDAGTTRDGSVNILGVNVTAWDGDSLIGAMIATATGEIPPCDTPLSTVHYANVHVLNTAYRNPELRRQLARASTVFCDGSGVRLGAAILGGSLPERLPAADIIDGFCASAARARLRLFLIAGADGVAERAAEILRARHPALHIVGTHHGFLDAALSGRVVAEANDAGADLLIVGMGTPVQELWVAEHRDRVKAPVVWTVGALFDFVAGEQRRAPSWLARAHLEWLWRLGTDPRRLAGRYLIGNPLFCIRVISQRLGRSAS